MPPRLSHAHAKVPARRDEHATRPVRGVRDRWGAKDSRCLFCGAPSRRDVPLGPFGEKTPGVFFASTPALNSIPSPRRGPTSNRDNAGGGQTRNPEPSSAKASAGKTRKLEREARHHGETRSTPLRSAQGDSINESTARPVRLRCAPLRVTALTRARQDPRSASLPTTMLGAGRAGFRLRCAPLRVTALVRGLCDALAQSALQTITPAGARPSEPASAPVAGPGPAAASSRCRSPPGPRPMRRRKG